MIAWALSALGLLILLLAGDALVRGAVNLSLRLGIPALIVSLTIVAFGTSAPELLIGVSAVLDGKPGLALGNVVGSNTANVLLVLGVPAMFAGLATSSTDSRRAYSFMIVATCLFLALAYFGTFTWISGLILLTVLSIVLFDTLRQARGQETTAPEVEDADPDMPGWQIALFLIAGLAGLPLGADLLVDNASIIARSYGVSETIIGLTLVAIGTSLPELATTVMAAIRRQADVALGNVIGSNMFNLLAIMGVASLVAPIPVDPEFLRIDLWVMMTAGLFLAPIVYWRMNITRSLGFILTALYVIYISIVIF